jgi:alpha-tubulin suppressor-like RCC1 family protein
MSKISVAHRVLLLAALAVSACDDEPTHPSTTSALPEEPSRLVISSPLRFIALGAGIIHSCAVRQGGVVECWGSDAYGQAPASRYSSDPSHSSFIQVAASSAYTCGLRDDEAVECWGEIATINPPPVMPRGYVQIAGGRDHTCALVSAGVVNGVVECWGSNTYGQAPATKAAATGSFTQVDGGFYHTCALRSDGWSSAGGQGR